MAVHLERCHVSVQPASIQSPRISGADGNEGGEGGRVRNLAELTFIQEIRPRMITTVRDRAELFGTINVLIRPMAKSGSLDEGLHVRGGRMLESEHRGPLDVGPCLAVRS